MFSFVCIILRWLKQFHLFMLLFPGNSFWPVCQMVVVFLENTVENSTIRLPRPWVQLCSPVPARCCHPMVHGCVWGRGRQVPIWRSCTPTEYWDVQIPTLGAHPVQPGTTMPVKNPVKVNDSWLPWISLKVFVHCLCFNMVCYDEHTDPAASNTLYEAFAVTIYGSPRSQTLKV